MSTQRTQTPESVDIAHHRAVALDPLENGIVRKRTLADKLSRHVVLMLEPKRTPPVSVPMEWARAFEFEFGRLLGPFVTKMGRARWGGT